LIIDSTIVVDRGIQIAHNLTVALVCCCVLLVLLCVHWQGGSSEPSRIMRRQRKARSFAFAFVALLLLPLNQTGKRAEAKETRSQDPCSF
jgi:ATP/ADP translocase